MDGLAKGAAWATGAIILTLFTFGPAAAGILTVFLLIIMTLILA